MICFKRYYQPGRKYKLYFSSSRDLTSAKLYPVQKMTSEIGDIVA